MKGTFAVASGGILTLAYGLVLRMIGSDPKIILQRTLNVSTGKIEFVEQDEDKTYTPVYSNSSGETRSVTFTGTLTIAASNFQKSDFLGNTKDIYDFANSTAYHTQKTIVVTSVASALAVSNDTYLYDTFTDLFNVNITMSDTLYVESSSNVTLDTVTLTDGTALDLTEGIVFATVRTSQGRSRYRPLPASPSLPSPARRSVSCCSTGT